MHIQEPSSLLHGAVYLTKAPVSTTASSDTQKLQLVFIVCVPFTGLSRLSGQGLAAPSARYIVGSQQIFSE